MTSGEMVTPKNHYQTTLRKYLIIIFNTFLVFMSTNKKGPPVWLYYQGYHRNLPEGCNTANIRTWNTNTLYQLGRLDNLLREMSRLKIDLLGVSETHWTTSDVPESFEEGNYVVINSSRKDNIHRQGVAIIMTKDIAKNLKDYTLISERLMSVEIETKKGPLLIFQVYAPDTSYDDADVDEFYRELQPQSTISQQRKII